MKLTVKKIRYIINHKKKGESSESIRKDMKISKRRVEQVWKFYSETGKEPIIGKNMGRPVKTLDPKEEEIISIAFDRYKFGTKMLEKILDGFYEMHIPHNRIHNGASTTPMCRRKQALSSTILKATQLRRPEDSPRWSRKYLINENLKGGFKGGILNFHSAFLMPR